MTFKEKTKSIVSESSFIQLEKYVNMIEEKNKIMNLTGFKNDLLWQQGIYDSIISIKETIKSSEENVILDIGAGAGFPSVPFLIAYPNNKLYISEPTLKRCAFLEEVKKELNLNMTIMNERVEEMNYQLGIDVVCARAVGHLKILIEIAHRIADIGAQFLFMKGPKVFEEIKDSKWIIDKLNVNPTAQKIDVSYRESYVVKYNKKTDTPSSFPREWKLIKK